MWVYRHAEFEQSTLQNLEKIWLVDAHNSISRTKSNAFSWCSHFTLFIIPSVLQWVHSLSRPNCSIVTAFDCVRSEFLSSHLKRKFTTVRSLHTICELRRLGSGPGASIPPKAVMHSPLFQISPLFSDWLF